MGRTKEQQREYMREYRLRTKHALVGLGETPASALAAAHERIGLLTEEIRHLKEELAKRPPASIVLNAADFHQVQRIAQSPGPDGRYSTRPFTPVPKKGK